MKYIFNIIPISIGSNKPPPPPENSHPENSNL